MVHLASSSILFSHVRAALNHVLGTMAAYYAVTFAAIVLLTIFRPLIATRRIQAVPFSRRRFVGGELPWSFATLFVAGLLGVAVVELRAAHLLVIDVGPASPRRILGELAVYALSYDLYFYFLHRLLHWGPLYTHVHRVHHDSTTPNPLTAFVFHPVEATITGGFVVGLLSIGHFHQTSLLAIAIFGVTASIVTHCGYDFYPKWWHRNPVTRLLISTSFHDLHHQLYRRNYGAFTTVYDRLFGTLALDCEARETLRPREFGRRFESRPLAEDVERRPEASTSL